MRFRFLLALFCCSCGHSTSTPGQAVSAVPPTWVKAAMTATACKIQFGFTNTVSVFFDASVFGPSEISCLATAGTDCDRARACMNLQQPATPCNPTAVPHRCDGDVFRWCSPDTIPTGYMRAFDCSSIGQHCFGAGVCAVASCTEAGFSCDGDTVVSCSLVDDGQGTGSSILVSNNQTDCTALGEICQLGSSNLQGQCSLSETPCTVDTHRCESDTLVYTCKEGSTVHIDCAKQGLHCFDQRSTCGLGPQCITQSVDDSCANGKITGCLAGALITADCAAAGFSGCDQNGCVP